MRIFLLLTLQRIKELEERIEAQKRQIKELEEKVRQIRIWGLALLSELTHKDRTGISGCHVALGLRLGYFWTERGFRDVSARDKQPEPRVWE